MRYLTKVMSKAKALRPECMSAWLEGQPPTAGGNLRRLPVGVRDAMIMICRLKVVLMFLFISLCSIMEVATFFNIFLQETVFIVN